MNTSKLLSLALTAITLAFVLGAEQANADDEDRCILFTFKGTPQEIESGAQYIRQEMVKDKNCSEVKFGYPDDKYREDLGDRLGRQLGAGRAEKDFPRNRLSFSCVKQNLESNAFGTAGRAYLALPMELVTNSIELTATTSCCTSASCVSYHCAGDDTAKCWDKNRVCRRSCAGCSQ